MTAPSSRSATTRSSRASEGAALVTPAATMGVPGGDLFQLSAAKSNSRFRRAAASSLFHSCRRPSHFACTVANTRRLSCQWPDKDPKRSSTVSPTSSSGPIPSTRSLSIVAPVSLARRSKVAPVGALSPMVSAIRSAKANRRRCGSTAAGMSAPSGSSSGPNASSRSKSPTTAMRGINKPGLPCSPA